MTFISKFSYLIVKTLINLFEVVHSFGPFAILSSELKQNLNHVEIEYTTDVLTSSSTILLKKLIVAQHICFETCNIILHLSCGEF